MKAARIYGTKDIRIEEIPIRDPKRNEVQLKVKYSGICGSDIHAYEYGWALPTVPHPITGQELPVVLGHEFSGEIVKVGSAVKKFKIGNRVTVEPLIYCGECEACKKGFRNCCENAVGEDGSGNVLGFGLDGGFAEYANVDATSVYKLPEELDYQLGALMEPVAVAVQAVKKSSLRAGQTVAIFGAGPIGLLVAIVAKQTGASDIVVVDISEERLKRAKAIGIKHTLNPTKINVLDTIMKITGNGVDVAFDVAGVQTTLDTASGCVKNTGIIQIVAVFGNHPTVRFSEILMKGVDIRTTLCYSNVFPEAIRLVNQAPDLYRNVITKIIAIEDLVSDGIEVLLTEKSQAKILVEL